MRTLLVDDAVSLRLLVRAALHADGDFHVVAEAGDGREAIRCAARWRPDVVLLDLSMPVMDGIEALPRILAASPTSRVVVFTGFGEPEVLRRAREAGAHGVIEKGLSPRDLCAAIRAVVRDAAGPGYRLATGPVVPPATGPNVRTAQGPPSMETPLRNA